MSLGSGARRAADRSRGRGIRGPDSEMLHAPLVRAASAAARRAQNGWGPAVCSVTGHMVYTRVHGRAGAALSTGPAAHRVATVSRAPVAGRLRAVRASMGIFGRRGNAGAPARILRLPPGVEPAWLPGTVEVQVVGATFHVAEINAAARSAGPGARVSAVLVAEPDNPHDANAVAVYFNGYLAGQDHLAMIPAPKTAPATKSSNRALQAALACSPVPWSLLSGSRLARLPPC